MRVTIVGILTDHRGHVLLRQINRSTLAPVRQALPANMTPGDALAAAFRQQTGLIVLPVRPTGVYADDQTGELTICYRCTMRGGALKPPEGQPAAGFFDARPLPRGLNRADRRPLEDALGHAGGSARLARLPAGPAARLRGLLGRVDYAGPAPDWAVTARLVVDAGEVGVLWTRPGATGRWRLPSLAVGAGNAPWEAVAALLAALGITAESALPDLRLIELTAGSPSLDFVFVARPAAALPPSAGTPDLILAPLNAALAAEGFEADDVALAGEAMANNATVVRVAP